MNYPVRRTAADKKGFDILERKPDGTLIGKPEEILHYIKLEHEQSHSKPYKEISGTTDVGWMQQKTIISSGTTIKRCDGPCLCTGRCEGKQQNTNDYDQRKYGSYQNNIFKMK